MLFEEFRIEDYGDVRYKDGAMNRAIENAIKMYDDGVAIEKISKWTSLEISVIEEALKQRVKTEDVNAGCLAAT